ncbi:hypothetical protein F511_42493 [Dorcoceras hygrometricum]|uniref:Uncharacterized protein n=1 Tax=Dorcoceras hygrometricum TaxID=472368 RepID=A0A2Z6ZYR7_9LAMI|nr:hypothetical protein F511_42493 [Dorcoceras hygrometricum]
MLCRRTSLRAYHGDSGMVKMFKSLEDSELKGFLEASDSVSEEAVLEFFANAKVLARTIVSLVGARHIAITKDMFIAVFGLPYEGMTSFLTIPKETVLEMRRQFSRSDEPFRAPNKKREMKTEFRLLHDIVAKALCTKFGSFDQEANIKARNKISKLIRKATCNFETHEHEQQLRAFAPVHDSFQKWCKMIELLERSPTLPHTSKTTTGNAGNSSENSRLNSALGFER